MGAVRIARKAHKFYNSRKIWGGVHSTTDKVYQ